MTNTENAESGDLLIYEAGIRSRSGRYAKFIESPNPKEVEEYIETMKLIAPEVSRIVYLTKTYRLISTEPHIVSVDDTPPTEEPQG